MRVISNLTEQNEIARLSGVKPQSINEAELRSSVALAAGSNVVVPFNKTNKGTKVLANDVLLDTENGFIITGIGFGVGKIGSATPNSAQYLAAKLHQFPNPYIFDGANESVAVPALFNSMASIDSNTKIMLDGISLRRLARVPRVAQGQPLVFDGTATLTAEIDSAEPNMFYVRPVKPILVEGTQTLNFNVNFGESLTFTESGETNFLQVVFQGYLVRK